MRFENSRPGSAAPVILFDSAVPGHDAEERLEIDLSPGRYGLATLNWEPDERTSLLLHRLEPLRESSPGHP